MVDAPADEPIESTTTQDLEIAGSHPCLTEPADLPFYASNGVDGVAIPTGFSFTQGNCKSLIAETTQTSPGIGTFPMLYTFVTFPAEGLGTTEADCVKLTSFSRVYVKVGTATAWTFVGEAHRYGVWSNNTCTQVRGLHDPSVNIPLVSSTKRTIRIVASAAYSRYPTGPVILFDREPLFPEQ